MAKEDFCFTYYDGDAARDKAHMTRLERGAYDDIISAQRKRGHLSIDDVKRVLSGDFEKCWPSLEWILKVDGEGKYFIEWVDKSLEKMRKHSEKQKEKINARWGKKIPEQYQNDTAVLPQNNHGNDPVIPLENGDGNVLCSIKNEIDTLILENEENRIGSNTLADYLSGWLTKMNIRNEREYFVKNQGERSDRFDLMVFDAHGSPALIIEVKNYSRHDDYYKPLRQIERYSKHNLPILFLPNFRTAYDRLSSCYKFVCDGVFDASFVFIPTNKSIAIVPDMLNEFKLLNPGYPADQKTDFPALMEIARKIIDWEQLGGDVVEPDNVEVIKRRWGDLVPFIRADQHFGGYSILQINKYFQSIVQRFNNATTVTNKSTFASSNQGKPGTSEARVQAAKDY